MPPAETQCHEHSGCTAKIENLEKSDTDQWVIIRNIQNRPPVWTTVLISILTFALGASVTYAKFAVEMAEIKATAAVNQSAMLNNNTNDKG